MADKASEYDKSFVEINIQFDIDREIEFKSILNKKFGCKEKIEEAEAEAEDQIEFLEADFLRRAQEVRIFRKTSMAANAAPILAQALVRKVKKRLGSVEVSDIRTPTILPDCTAKHAVCFVICYYVN